MKDALFYGMALLLGIAIGLCFAYKSRLERAERYIQRIEAK